MYLRGLYILAALIPVCVSAQSGGNPAFTHFSVKDGLPARTVYDIIQDKKGYMWLATELGICRYDGYTFWQPPTPEAAMGSAFTLKEDSLGRIWYKRLNGSLWHFDGDSIRPWKYNHLLPKYKNKAGSFSAYNLSPKGDTVRLVREFIGIIRVDPDGTETMIHPPVNTTASFIYQENGRMIFSNYEEFFSRSKAELSLLNSRHGHPTYWGHESKWEKIEGVYLQSAHKLMAFLAIGDTALCFNAHSGFFAVHQGRQLWKTSLPLSAFDKLQISPTGEIFLGVLEGERGALFFNNLEAVRKGEYTRYLSGYSVTSVCVDASGGYWFTTHEDGIFYATGMRVRTWDTRDGLAHAMVLNLAQGPKNQLLIGLRNGRVQRFHINRNHIESLPEATDLHYSADLAYDAEHDLILASAPNLMVFKNGKWRKWWVMVNNRLGLVISHSIHFSSDRQRLLLVCTDGYEIIPNHPLEVLELNRADFHERTRTVYEDPLGRIWVATVNGLYQHINGQVIPRKNLHPFMEERGPERICNWRGDHLVFGLMNKGVLVWGPDSQFVHIGPERGLQYQALKHICEDAQGNLWVATNTGLFKLSRDAQAQWSVKRFTTAHGLPDSEVNDILPDSSGYLWVATSNGLCHFHEPAPLKVQPQPFLSEVHINGNAINIRRENALHYDENNIKVGFLTLNYRQLGHIFFRYRLHGDDAWNYTYQHQVEFSQLAPGSYRFEVQSQDETGVWSESGTWAFRVLPPWWATWWFRGLAALAVGALAYFWYRRRIRQINQRTALEKQVRELENAALQAQMNPHFIFNCLNSIQKFIVSNDADSAVIYLANFAKLVRSTLHASVEGRITLLEEVRMLGNYLSLEQLRFKNVFEYRIDVDDSLDQMSVVLPPMMVQPFVENAIIHGMKQKGSDGFIQIRYAQPDASTLLITVEDNGPGMGERNSSGQKSLGRNLTARRLELLNQQSKNSAITVQYTTPDSGSGVLVQLRLPLRIETPQHLATHTP
ncbi:MAG: histidine kinase [Saprospiraceae bacterium]|nr:histidine kinase [Saprospiraceae bacterium]